MNDNAAKKDISAITLLRVFFRSFFIQSGWNFERMQNLGFAYSIMPALKKIYRDNSDALKDSLKRHLDFFNTHPYFSAPILGATIRLEEEYKKEKIGAEDIIAFKNSLMGICGGIGDGYFWGVLRPLCGIFGIIIAIIAKSILAVFVCLILYNIEHLSFRLSSLFLGYKEGVSVTNCLMEHDFRTKTKRLKFIQAFSLGLLLALINSKFIIYNFSTMFYNATVYLVFIFLFFLLYFLIKKKLSPIIIIYVITVIVISINYLK